MPLDSRGTGLGSFKPPTAEAFASEHSDLEGRVGAKALHTPTGRQALTMAAGAVAAAAAGAGVGKLREKGVNISDGVAEVATAAAGLAGGLAGARVGSATTGAVPLGERPVQHQPGPVDPPSHYVGPSASYRASGPQHSSEAPPVQLPPVPRTVAADIPGQNPYQNYGPGHGSMIPPVVIDKPAPIPMPTPPPPPPIHYGSHN